jgi:DNA repair protein RadA/Sms
MKTDLILIRLVFTALLVAAGYVLHPIHGRPLLSAGIAAIASSFGDAPLNGQTAVFGEVGLTGEVRGAMQAQARAREAQTLGFKKLIMPASNAEGLQRLLNLRVVGVRTVEEALRELF